MVQTHVNAHAPTLVPKRHHSALALCENWFAGTGVYEHADVDVSVRKQVLHRGTVADGHKLERDAVVEGPVTLGCRKHEVLDAAREDVVLQPHLSLNRAPGLTETTGDALFRRKE